jgi:hypothetical protein
MNGMFRYGKTKAPPMREVVSQRVVEQRIRNRVMEVLEKASSFREQMLYQQAVQWVHIPYEIVNQWEDWVHVDPRIDPNPLPIYTADEVDALGEFHGSWEAAVEALPADYPTIVQVQQIPEWGAMRDAAIVCLEVFARRGRMSEEEEHD